MKEIYLGVLVIVFGLTTVYLDNLLLETQQQRDKLASIVLWEADKSEKESLEVQDFLNDMDLSLEEIGPWSFCY